ncbi:MAG TPA: exodeoxyribonuclease VII large subunit, partial [Bryobacteraceae bacterium]|nr:exodeoxyribonuclease VII large subunit [Bryobacteraceae bacterium]
AHRRLEAATVELQRLWQVRVNADRRRLESLTAHLTQLSPVKVLERGYAIVRDEQGHVVRDVDSVTADQRLRVRVATGEFSVRVDAE